MHFILPLRILRLNASHQVLLRHYLKSIYAGGGSILVSSPVKAVEAKQGSDGGSLLSFQVSNLAIYCSICTLLWYFLAIQELGVHDENRLLDCAILGLFGLLASCSRKAIIQSRLGSNLAQAQSQTVQGKD